MGFQYYIIKRDKSTPHKVKHLYEWVSRQIESVSYERQDDKDILCTPLRKCYQDMLKEFPALNGRDSTDDEDLIDKALDYSLAPNVIMVDCGLSQAVLAIHYCHSIARKYGLCIYCIKYFSLLDEGNKPPLNVIERHLTCDYPTSGKAIISSLINPIIVAAIIFSCYFLIKLFILLYPLPYYVPSIHISTTMITVVAVVVGVVLFCIELRNARRGRENRYDEPVSWMEAANR